jgi:hypothetical protein
MGKDWKYIAYLVLLAVIFVSVFLSQEKQYDWKVTLAHEDKNPYGTFVLNELLPSAFGQGVETNYRTFYEFKDSLRQFENVVILSTNFGPGNEDVKAMLDYVDKGGVIFVSTNHLGGLLADTLGLLTSDNYFDGNFSQNQNDSAFIQMANPRLDTARRYYFKSGSIASYFSKADSARKNSRPAEATVIAKNSAQKPVAIKINRGKGFFIFNSTPLIFTNIYLLDKENNLLISSLLSYLPEKKIHRSEYYQLGRMEAATPIRFILQNESLRWAYYIAIISILLFIVFEAKRTQRPIPMIMPLANTSLEFVATIGTLYFERKDHKAIATRKILFFLESLRERFNFSLPLHSAENAKILSHKAGKEEDVVRHLMELMNQIANKEKITEDELKSLNTAIQKFWNK